jgi:hypothetical protein
MVRPQLLKLAMKILQGWEVELPARYAAQHEVVSSQWCLWRKPRQTVDLHAGSSICSQTEGSSELLGSIHGSSKRRRVETSEATEH